MWDLLRGLARRTSDPGQGDADVPPLEGRHLHYLSRGKVRTLAAELGLDEDVEHKNSLELGVGPVKGTQERTTTRHAAWPVDLAARVTERLVKDGRVTSAPDYSKRYVHGRMDAVGGTLGAMDHHAPAAWFVGEVQGSLILLCGSATHLRDRIDGEATPTWFPSRLESLAMVVRSLTDFAAGDQLTQPEYVARPGNSHAQTVTALLGALDDSVRRGTTFLEGWVEFVALKHFALPMRDERRGQYSQVLLGSPLWVCDYEDNPPAGWYPDPAMASAPGCFRYWDGGAWTYMSFASGSELNTPPPPHEVRPRSALLPGRISPGR